MRRSDSLIEVQRRFASLVTRLGRTDGMRDPDGSGSGPCLLARFRSDRDVSAIDRLSIYDQAYFARIHDALRGDHEALYAAIGKAAFHDLAKLYLMAHPSRSFSLRFVGDRLPDFLAGPFGEPFRSRWPFVADLASLERARVDVFDAADEGLLERCELVGVSPEGWAELRFSLIAAHRLLRLDWPVHALQEACATNQAIPEIVPAPTTILVHRRRERVVFRPLGEFEAQALQLVRDDVDFAAICGFASDELGDAEGARRVLELLERWMSERLLASLEGPRSPGASPS